MRQAWVKFVLVAFLCGALNAEEFPVPTDHKSEPVSISIPDVLTDLPSAPVKSPIVDAVEKVEVQEPGASSFAANVVDFPKTVEDPPKKLHDVVSPVSTKSSENNIKAQKAAPNKSFLNNAWPEVQVTQVEHITHEHDRRPPRPYSTAEGVCSSLCHRNGKGFLYVENNYCWCRCDVQECHHSSFRAIPPPLRNASCRDHCRSIHSRDSPDGFYDRGRDSCVCQCTPCIDFNKVGPPHTRCN